MHCLLSYMYPCMRGYIWQKCIDLIFQKLPSTKAAPNNSQSKIAIIRISIFVSSLINYAAALRHLFSNLSQMPKTTASAETDPP